MRILINICLIGSIIFSSVYAQNYLGAYVMTNYKSKILSPVSTITIEKNKIVFLKTFFHQDGWKVFKGKWQLKHNEIRITELYDTAGIMPQKNNLIVEIDPYDQAKDSIRIKVSDVVNFTEVEPAIISINNLPELKCKSTDSVFIKFEPISKIYVELWGFRDSIVYKNPQKVSSIKITLLNNRQGTSNYFYKDIRLLIRNKNIFLTDGSKLKKLKN